MSSTPTVNVPLNCKLAELSPEIQFTEPSTPSDITSCLSAVAVGTSAQPIVTLPSPLVIL